MQVKKSTCHWCHVMAHESFEDREVAELLNQSYVCVKVDREERPDIDAVYMSVCQALTGSGGWPLTILMTPEQKPFFAGTYLPKHTGWGANGLMELLGSIRQLWKENPKQLLEAGEAITELIRGSEEGTEEEGTPEKGILLLAARMFERMSDQTWGGFGQAPKFPTPHNLLFLFRHFAFEQNRNSLEIAEKTLMQMYRGGIYDHIGGGFSRYSTDERWLVPHFEKMLYDNALLLYAYAEAYRSTSRRLYQTVADGIFRYLCRELTDEAGGFYCGQDADSEGIEGKYYIFAPSEIECVLGKKNADFFCKWFGITEEGNFEGKSIPNLIANESFEEQNSQIELLCDQLYEYRKNRTQLHRDDKILTSWNALMIAALAKAYKIFGRSEYLTAAVQAEKFIVQNLTDENGRLFLRYRDGQQAHKGQLDDYAFYALGLLELYEASYDVAYLNQCREISSQMLKLFGDEVHGGFYMSASDSEALIHRPKEFYDGAVPSGNSVAAYVLSQLSNLTGETVWKQEAEKQISHIAKIIREYPANYSFSLLALQRMLYPSVEIVCVTAGTDIPEGMRELYLHYTSNLSVLLKTPGNAQKLAEAAPFTKDYPIPAEGSSFYICRGGACMRPVNSMEMLQEVLCTEFTKMI